MSKAGAAQAELIPFAAFNRRKSVEEQRISAPGTGAPKSAEVGPRGRGPVELQPDEEGVGLGGSFFSLAASGFVSGLSAGLLSGDGEFFLA